MIRSLYLAGTGMLVQRNKMDVISNNITNVETLGYKKDTLLSRSFKEMLLDRLNDPSIVNRTVEVGPFGPGVHVDEVATTFTNGSPEQTDLRTDMCIVGPAFFAVETGEGERYTRSGNFTLNAEGYLLNSDGNYVLDDGGSHIQLTSDRFKVDQLGTIYNLDDGEEVAKLKLVEFADVKGLRKSGNNLYYHYQNQEPVAAEKSTVMQGYIESSNVNIAQEMVDMIITSRAYESNQRAVRMIDETLARTVNDIAKF